MHGTIETTRKGIAGTQRSAALTVHGECRVLDMCAAVRADDDVLTIRVMAHDTTSAHFGRPMERRTTLWTWSAERN